MTDRVKGFTVTLDKDIRIDDVEFIMNAIRAIKHVVHVEPSITTANDYMMQQRIKIEIQKKLLNFMKENL